MEKWTKRFLLFSGAALFQRAVWFFTMNTQSDFPTSEVQYAVIPALLHPYRWPWQAPYGIIWYGLQYIVVAAGWPFVYLANLALNIQCPLNCQIPIHYVNGTTFTIPFEAGPLQFLLGISWMIGLTIMDLPFYWIFRKSELLVSYLICSLWLFATTPVNQSILWLTSLGFLHPGFLVLAPIAKLPFGSELISGNSDVWTFALGSAGTIGHWFPYGMLALWWGGCLIHWIDLYAHKGNSIWIPWLNRNARAVKNYE